MVVRWSHAAGGAPQVHRAPAALEVTATTKNKLKTRKVGAACRARGAGLGVEAEKLERMHGTAP